MNQASSKDSGRESQGSTTSLSLLQLAKSHDDRAWDRIFYLYAPLVCRVCRSSRIPAAEWDDVCQDVFLAAHKKIDDFERERKGSFRRWFTVIARNTIISRLRRDNKKPRASGGTDAHVQIQQLPAPDENETTEDITPDDRSILVQRALEMIRVDFKEKTWQAFQERSIQGRAVPAVAERLGMSTWSVYQANSRVMKRLREVLAELVD